MVKTIIELDESHLSLMNPDIYKIRNDLMSIPVFQVSTQEAYKKAQVLAQERFGKRSKAYKTIMNGIDVENATGSQFFFNNLVEEAMSFNDLEEIYKSGRAEDLFDGSFYADTIDLILRTATPSWEPNKKILEHLAKQVNERGFDFSSGDPVRISGVELVQDKRAGNDYGLLLELGQNTQLVNDKRFAYGNNQIQLGDTTIPLYTKENGLSRVYLYRYGGLVSWDDYLAYSNDDGRVVAKSRSD